MFIQEAVDLSRGQNFVPMRMRYKLPQQQTGVGIYLLSDSFEYDIQLIKDLPHPKLDYRSIVIPYKIITKIGVRPFRYIMRMDEYTKRISYIDSQKLNPPVIPLRFPYPKDFNKNTYVSMSNIISMVSPFLKYYPIKYIQNNIYDLFTKVMGFLDFGKDKLLVIDTSRYKIYQEPNQKSLHTDLINALIASYVLNSKEQIKPLNWIIIFRSPDGDFKFDLSSFEQRDIQRLKSMLKTIGIKNDDIMDMSEEDEEKLEDELIEAIDKPNEDISPALDGEIKQIEDNSVNVTSSLKSSLNSLTAQYGQIDTVKDKDPNKDSLYNAKTLDINASLLKRITPASDKIANYKTIADDLTPNGENPVEKGIIDNAAKKVADVVTPVDTTTTINAVTSEREKQIRQQVGQVKLNNVTFSSLTSVTDVPKPEPLKPVHLTTTNAGAIKGSSFAHISSEYEEKLMDRDIVATFMNFSKLPDGFYVTNVEVTDISSVTSLVNNWKVTLKNKNSDRQSVINIRVPRVINGRFYNNGIWYTIGKQDFPIPVLKIDKKTVIITSNYNKITCSRYDTRSMIDISMLMKTIDKAMVDSGKNKYVRVGNSSNTNSRFVSTIEYDEYAKKWLFFKNEAKDMQIYFNRVQCEKLYNFVSVQQNEFCCGMINKVPIVVNTETGKTRNDETLTDLMLQSLPEELVSTYMKQKPGKMSMYSEITIGDTIPAGVAIAAWEGLTSLIKKSGIKCQYVPANFKDSKYIVIPFKDRSLAVENSTVAQLLFNGFFRINTKAYNITDFEKTIMDSNSVFVDIFNQLFFKQYSRLTMFITYYNFFIDAITADVCSHYNIPNDIAGIIIYATRLLADNNHTSENNAALYRIRSSEIIPAIIHYRLALAISKYNHATGSKSRGNAITFNPNEVIQELLAVQNVGTSSALNPMIELHEQETITKKGFRGVNNDRAYSQMKRTYDDTMIGKMGLSSPNSANVGINRQLVADPKIESVRGYTSTSGVDTNYNDLQLASFSELLTPGTVSRDDAIRTAIATSQTSHIVSTDGAQPVLISNGVDELVPAYLSEEFSYVAREDGKVIDMDDMFMIVQYKSGKKKAINIDHKQSFNSGSGFYVDNKLKPNFKVGESFKRGDVLAYHEKYFTRDIDKTVRMNVGPLAKVAFAGLYSTYEDAGLVTTKMSKKLSSTLSMMQSIKIDAMDDIESIVKVGTEVEINDPLVVFGLGDTGDKSVDNFLKAFQSNKDGSNPLDSAKRVIKAKNAGRVADVRMYTTKSMDRLSPTLFKIFDEYFKENIKKRRILDKHDKTNSVYKMDTLYSLPTEPLKGSTIKGQTCDVLIEIYIEHPDEASVGDKLAIFGASKQVLSEVVPEGMEPYTETRPDEEVSLFVAPSCILKRMIPSLIITASANKVLVELKNQMRDIWKKE